MGRTVSDASGYAPEAESNFDPRIDDFESKERKYLHFDLPVPDVNRAKCSFTEQEIRKNSFWPLLGYKIEERRVKKDDTGALVFSTKERPIKFGSHVDAQIYEYCGKYLSIDYENFLSQTGFSVSVLTYRSGIGNNVDHSKSLFDEIRLRGDCTAIALDIKGFFDHINHSSLYTILCKVRNVVRLTESDFRLFKRMTAFEWVDHDELRKRLGNKCGRLGRLCTSDEFRRLIRTQQPSLITVNDADHGIPQGTPLSGLYANIAMLGFDERVTQLVHTLGGTYRRYSDDIALVLPKGEDPNISIALVEAALQTLGLHLSNGKTDISTFERVGGTQTASKPFQYLGFTFDGQKTLIRQSSLNRYYTKMNRGIRAKVYAAKKNNVDSKEIYMRDLFKKYTHFGQFRNFPRYAYRAANVHQAPEINKQVARHMNIFKKMVKQAIDAIY